MKDPKLKFSDFESEQMTKKQQKAIRGGDGEGGDKSEPKNGGGGSGNG